MGEAERHAGFLPPKASGPEPDLADRQADAAPQPSGPDPSGSLHRGFAPPAEHDAHAAAAQAEHPAASPAAVGWSASAPGSATAPQPRSAPTTQSGPDNGAAVAGLSLSIASGVLLVLSVGASSIVSIVCAALGIHYSRKGRERFDRGETPRHRGVAQAGFVTGMVALGLSILCTLLWLLAAVLYASNEEFRQELRDQLDDGGGDPPNGLETSLELGVRLVALLVR